MVAAFMQGMLLMGIIYWYSKGLMNMINDYYRSEFNRKLKTESARQKPGDINSQSYDLDDMEELLNIEMNKEYAYEGVRILDINEFSDSNETQQLSRVCYKMNNKREFLNILFIISYNHYKMHPFKYPICWFNENNT